MQAFSTDQAEGRQSPAGAVASEQRLELAAPVVAATEDGARALGRVYWEEVERCTRGLVRSRSGPAGVELRLLGRTALLRVGPAEVRLAGDVVICRYPILGGLLVRAPGGSISFAQQGGPSPELRSGALYGHVQARVHRAVGRRCFARLLRGELG